MNDVLKRINREKRNIRIIQICLGLSFIILWELFSRFNIINSFIFSSPSKIFVTLIELYKNNNLFNNIYVTLLELFISFILGSVIGFIIAIIFYRFNLWFNQC